MSRVIIKSQRPSRILILCGLIAAMCLTALTVGEAQAVPPSPVAFTMTMAPYARTVSDQAHEARK